jgi:hypothetical protein
MIYIIEMPSYGIIFLPSLLKIGAAIPIGVMLVLLKEGIYDIHH